MVDVLFVSSSLTFSSVAPSAPAILISMLEHAGYSGKFYDFNSYTKNDDNFKQYAISGYRPDNVVKFNQDFRYHVQKIKDLNPKFVGISVFTYQCQSTARLLCIYLRLLAPEIKIIVGGQGLSSVGVQGEHLGKEWEELNLCDYYVVSEGEYPIIDIVSGNHQNKTTWNQIQDLDEFPIPNYESYDLNLYNQIIPITGSRGCVRRCTFCDIHIHWQKFVFRSGKSIANEMIVQSQKHGIYHFAFTDSLINGSMKAYKEMCNELADYNRTADQPVTWEGQFIFRPKNQMPEDVWRLSSAAGLNHVYIGIENLSESVRDHMKKKFSNEDIIYGTQCMQKHNITGTFLMIVGYVTDNEETLQENLDMYTRLSDFAPNTIRKVAIGTTLAILPGTPLEIQAKELGVTLGKTENDWSGPSTLETRLKWRNDIIKHATSLGFFVPENEEQQVLIDKLQKEYA